MPTAGDCAFHTENGPRVACRRLQLRHRLPWASLRLVTPAGLAGFSWLPRASLAPRDSELAAVSTTSDQRLSPRTGRTGDTAGTQPDYQPNCRCR